MPVSENQLRSPTFVHNDVPFLEGRLFQNDTFDQDDNGMGSPDYSAQMMDNGVYGEDDHDMQDLHDEEDIQVHELELEQTHEEEQRQPLPAKQLTRTFYASEIVKKQSEFEERMKTKHKMEMDRFSPNRKQLKPVRSKEDLKLKKMYERL